MTRLPTEQVWVVRRRISGLSLDEARAEVLRLVAEGRVFETAPRALALGEAEAWLGPANREFCERFQRLCVVGNPWDLVLGAQTLVLGERVGLLASDCNVTQEAGVDAVTADGLPGMHDRPLPSLWHLALFAAATLPHEARPLRVVNAPRERAGQEPTGAAGCVWGCAAPPALVALSLWVGTGNTRAAFGWLVAAVAAGAAGWRACLGASRYEAEAREARGRARRWPLERARAAALAELAASDAEFTKPAPCALNCDLPLDAAVHELLSSYARVGEPRGTDYGWRLDRAELRSSDVLPGHVHIGRTALGHEIATRLDSGEVLVIQGTSEQAVIRERYPSVWHFLVGRLFGTPAAMAEAEQDHAEGRRRMASNDPRPSLDATRHP